MKLNQSYSWLLFDIMSSLGLRFKWEEVNITRFSDDDLDKALALIFNKHSPSYVFSWKFGMYVQWIQVNFCQEQYLIGLYLDDKQW